MTHDNFLPIIDAALAEDVGSGDITSALLIPRETKAQMILVAREPMVVCGTFVPAMVYGRLHPDIRSEALVEEGALVTKGQALVRVSGPAREVLTGERVVLNLMQRMCGIATTTRSYVDAVLGTKAIILDTRKTMPGLRIVDKYAVKTGGGKNHRMGLYDAVMIKDNHVALAVTEGGSGIGALVENVRKKLPASVPVIVECDTLEQVYEVVAAKPDRILLDNMDPEGLHRAVEIVAGRVPLEASGGVSLATVRAIANTGVDYISIGKITHSAPSVDIGADVVFSAHVAKR